MWLNQDKRRKKTLEEIEVELRHLRMPEAGLSRKQLKVVNGALEALCEARARIEVRPLGAERRLMRKVADKYDHGRR
jgi:hypothetical protein